MQLRGARRRRGVDRGFVMSDHADWPGLQRAIGATGAERVFVTHGSVAVLVRWLRENGLDGQSFHTEYGDEDAAEAATAPAIDTGIGAAPAGSELPANAATDNLPTSETSTDADTAAAVPGQAESVAIITPSGPASTP